MDDLMIRVSLLERNYRILAVGLPSVVMLACILGAQRGSTSVDDLRVRKLTLVDERGRELG